jgi:hypothetical protein
MIIAFILGGLACYALMRHRTPKIDPTCGGRFVPNGTPAQRDAIREGWRQHWQEHDRIMQMWSIPRVSTLIFCKANNYGACSERSHRGRL